MADLVYLSNNYEAHTHHIIQNPQFNQRPIIINVNGFEEESVPIFRDYIQEANETGQPRVQVYVDSYGGDAYALLGMIEAIKNSEIPVDTICTTKAMSAGGCLFAMGDQRYMSPEATLMFHNFQQSLKNDTPVNHIHEQAVEGINLQSIVMELIDARRGKAKGTIDKKVKLHGNWYLDAREAKKQLLCDFIGPAQKMRVEVLCNITFREQ